MSRTRKKQSLWGILLKRRSSKFRKFTGKHLCHSLFFLKKRLWQRCFPVNFEKFLRTPFLTHTSGGCFWRAFQSESTLYNFRTSCSKQAQYLKFKWKVISGKHSRSNIAETSCHCYAAGFQTPSLLMPISLVLNSEMFIYKNLMFGHESYLILLYLLVIGEGRWQVFS